MKGSIFALLGMIACSCATASGTSPRLSEGFFVNGYDSNSLIDIERRQYPGVVTSVQKALSIEEVKPQVNPAAKWIKLTYGPYKIKAQNVMGINSIYYQ
jgi:hypothetical protein